MVKDKWNLFILANSDKCPYLKDKMYCGYLETSDGMPLCLEKDDCPNLLDEEMGLNIVVMEKSWLNNFLKYVNGFLEIDLGTKFILKDGKILHVNDKNEEDVFTTVAKYKEIKE